MSQAIETRLNAPARNWKNIAATVAVVASIFTAGMTFNGLLAHAGDAAIHEGADAKNQRIDDRFDILAAPLFQHNAACAAQFNKLDEKLEDIRKYLMTRKVKE